MERYDHLAYPLAIDRGIGTFAEEGDYGPLGANIETWVQTLVLQALDRWLARYVRVERVTVTVSDSAIQIGVDYAVLAQGEVQFLTMEVTA